MLVLAACGIGKPAVVAEARLWQLAKHPTLPLYPAASIARGSSGAAVAELSIERDGTVSGVTIPEAPDQDIARAVAASVRAWRFEPFKPQSTNQALRVRGKLTIYFELTGVDGTVLSSTERIKQRSGSQ